MSPPSVRLYDEVDSVEGPGRPLEVNSLEGIPFKGLGFEGHMLLLTKPSPEPKGASWPHSDTFRGKSRRFEFRLQGRFTHDHISGEDVWFAIELAQVVGLSWAGRVSANWVMSVVSMLCAARGVAYSYNLELLELPDGNVVRPHLAFPLLAVDAIIKTPPGQQPPPLLQPMDALSLSEKRKVAFNTTDTFTFGFWCKQADFDAWKFCNMPLGWSASFSSFIGSQSVHICVYRLQQPLAEGDRHTERNKLCICRLVLSSSRAKASGSSGLQAKDSLSAKQALQEEGEGKLEAPTSPDSRSPSSRPRPWCLEEAELPLEELDRLWANRQYSGSERVVARRGWFSAYVVALRARGLPMRLEPLGGEPGAAMQKGSLQNVLAGGVCAVIGLAVAVSLAWGLAAVPLLPPRPEDASWGAPAPILTVADYYCLALCLCAITIATDNIAGVLWSLLILLLGAPFACAYVSYRLFRGSPLRLLWDGAEEMDSSDQD